MQHDEVGPPVLPSGIYELVMDERLAETVAALDPSCFDVDTRSLDPGDSHALLARHLCGFLLRRLQEYSGERRLAQQVDLCNAILALLRREGEGLLPDAAGGNDAADDPMAKDPRRPELPWDAHRPEPTTGDAFRGLEPEANGRAAQRPVVEPAATANNTVLS